MAHKASVLVVDDDMAIRMMLVESLRADGHEITGEAGDGESALELYRVYQPDIVLMDISMPIMDGVAALKAIREMNPEACVVMLSSLTDRPLQEQCIEAGARAYIQKSTPLEQIPAMLDEIWAGGSAA